MRNAAVHVSTLTSQYNDGVVSLREAADLLRLPSDVLGTYVPESTHIKVLEAMRMVEKALSLSREALDDLYGFENDLP